MNDDKPPDKVTSWITDAKARRGSRRFTTSDSFKLTPIVAAMTGLWRFTATIGPGFVPYIMAVLAVAYGAVAIVLSRYSRRALLIICLAGFYGLFMASRFTQDPRYTRTYVPGSMILFFISMYIVFTAWFHVGRKWNAE